MVRAANPLSPLNIPVTSDHGDADPKIAKVMRNPFFVFRPRPQVSSPPNSFFCKGLTINFRAFRTLAGTPFKICLSNHTHAPIYFF